MKKKNFATHLKQAWKSALSIQKQVDKVQLFMLASSLAYTTLLSIIPALAVSFVVFQAFGGMQKIYNVLEPAILSNLAAGTGDEVIDILHGLIDKAHTTAVGVGGTIGLVFTTLSLLYSTEKSINLIWETPMNRSLWKRALGYLLVITLGPLGTSVAVGVLTSSELPLSHFLPGGTGMYLIAVGIFYCIYKWVPNLKVKPQYALTSAAYAAVLFNLARFGYLFYSKHVLSYNALYGSLGAIPILLLWIYIVWVVVLSGAALTAALQKTRVRTT